MRLFVGSHAILIGVIECWIFLGYHEASSLSLVYRQGPVKWIPHRKSFVFSTSTARCVKAFMTSRQSVEESSRTLEKDEAISLAQTELSKYFDFPLDDWQLEAGGSILMGCNVIVCAATGAGKTVVGEMALHIAYNKGLDGIYTTPLKALSNQKFAELRQIFGSADVGLSTGDISINRMNARLTVMTTEVYRNIAWRSSAPSTTETRSRKDDFSGELLDSNDLRKNAVVVLDEFHYMGLPGRGGVWEECVITSPQHTQIIGLSATLPNAMQLAEWMESVTGRRTRLIEATGSRPVPLKYLFATREGLYPLFRNPDAGPGSPMGLLGLRGDGIAPAGSSRGNKKQANGFGSKDSEESASDKVPRGLQVNPVLKGLAQRRLQKVNRMLERQKERQSQMMSQGEDDWDLYSAGGPKRGRRLNKSFKMTSREERKERERMMRREMRKAVPSLPILLVRLKEKNLLPAIFFIFSRAGCDQAADTLKNSFVGPLHPNIYIGFDDDSQENQIGKKKFKARQRAKKKNGIVEDEVGRSFRLSSNNVDEDVFNSVLDTSSDIAMKKGDVVSGPALSSGNWNFYSTAGLLSYVEVEEVVGRVTQFNEENPEIAFTEDVIEQFLFGVGRHHAGMLPAHKMFVEILFRTNLMKVVFATETLAAGINMPARTTVVCALAKRGGGGAMELLETSNLLQMAGRAGRRGMDVAGTCALVATPFEGEDIAAEILTNPIKPIASQFRPSYSLAVNLIARGQGKLEVAKQLVSRSFANWGRNRLENGSAMKVDSDGVTEVLSHVAEDDFMNTLTKIFNRKVQERSAQYDIDLLIKLIEILQDRDSLKKASKRFEATRLALELDETTLEFLELELKESRFDASDDVDLVLLNLKKEDSNGIQKQVEEQRERVKAAKEKIKEHPFTCIVDIANEIMNNPSPDKIELINAFQSIHGKEDSVSLNAEDIANFAKSVVVVKRKVKKLVKSNPDIDAEALLRRTEEGSGGIDSSWADMLAITRVLVAYGCLVPKSGFKDDLIDCDIENETFVVTPAGVDIGMLSFENSLWCFLALGGTWDVIGASSKFDEMKAAMDSFNDDFDFFDNYGKEPRNENGSEARNEAENLISSLRSLNPGEMAGYVSCLVTGDTVRSTVSSIDVFKRLSPQLQRSIQILLDGTERFMDVQRQFSVEERTCSCQFDLSHCEVVSAWANGCTWNEALEISGAAPGDLTRIIGRALDAVRQFGALKFYPVRKSDVMDDGGPVVDPYSRGIHPEVRRLCREAAKEMNRYPVKDPLPFEINEDEILDEIEVENEESTIDSSNESPEEQLDP